MTGTRERAAGTGRGAVRALVLRCGAALTGLSLGAGTAIVTLVTSVLSFVVVLLTRPVDGAREPVSAAVYAVARRAVDVESSRVSRFLGFPLPTERDRGPAVPYLLARSAVVSQSAVEKHVNAVFDKLDLAHATGYSRRVLASCATLTSSTRLTKV